MVHIASFIDDAAALDPGRAALIVGEVCTYGALALEVERWAATLVAAGVRPGDRVALVDWGGVRSTAVTLAAAHIGAATAQINPLLTPGEISALQTLSGCGPVTIDSGSVPVAGAASVPGPARAPAVERVGGGADDALVLFTSGTTGLPKAVPISHDAIGARVSAYRPPFSAAPERPPNVSLMCMPSFHVGGMLGLLLSLYAGDTVVIQPRFDAGEWLTLVERHRVTSAMVVPTMLARIVDHPALGAADLSSLALISYGAAAAPVDLVQRAMAALPHVGFANVFGQTETLGAYTTLSPDDHRDPRRIGSVGRPLPGVSVRVVVDGSDAGPGAVGELWVKAPVTDGWLQTGDLARVDADGYVYPAGRLSETINRGGEKFSPAEIADVVRSHPLVVDAAVAGVKDSEMGERVGVAIVVSSDLTLDDLRAFCRERLAPFKLPEVLVVTDALPYNELGKLPRSRVAAFIEENAS